MARRVFVHIGAPQSGTTYLRDRLARNRTALLGQGLDYLETRSGDHFEAALDLIQRPWAGELERAAGQWRVLSDAAVKSPSDVVISHEILAAATPEQVRAAYAGFGDAEVHLIVTVRDFGRQLPAEWQEMVRHQSESSLAAFIERVIAARRTSPKLWFWRVQSLPDVLTRWGSGLTPDRVHVVTVPQAGAPSETLWERFGSVLGIDRDRPYAPSAAPNLSLGSAQMAVLRRLNHLLHQSEVSRNTYVALVRELIAHEVFGRPEESETQLPETVRPFADEVTAEWVDWLEGSGVDIVGDLADLETLWSPRGRHPDPDAPDPTLVAEAAIEALAAVLVEVDKAPVAEDADGPVRRVSRRLLGS